VPRKWRTRYKSGAERAEDKVEPPKLSGKNRKLKHLETWGWDWAETTLKLTRKLTWRLTGN
jgi:hypothetical protein